MLPAGHRLSKGHMLPEGHVLETSDLSHSRTIGEEIFLSDGSQIPGYFEFLTVSTKLKILVQQLFALSAGAVEYTDCTSAEG